MEKKLNSLEAAKKLNQVLLDQEEVKSYQKYEASIEEHEEIAKAEEELKAMQKQMVLNKAKNIDDQELIDRYKQKKALFDEHPTSITNDKTTILNIFIFFIFIPDTYLSILKL